MFSLHGVFRSVKDSSEVRCWLEQEGAFELVVQTLKLMGVTMLVVGVNPVEVIRVSKLRPPTTLEGVSIVMPATDSVVFVSNAGAGVILRKSGRFAFTPAPLTR